MQMLLAVMVCCAVGALHRETVFRRKPFRVIIGGILHLLIDNRLEIRVLGRIDAQAAGVDHIVGLGVGVAVPLLQRILDLFDQLVGIIGIGAAMPGGLHVHILNAVIHLVREGHILLLPGNIALPVHLAEDDLPAGIVLFRMGDGIIPGRILGNACDNGALRERKVRHVLSEVAHRRGFYAQGIISQVNGIEIIREDRLPIHGFCQLQRQILLLDLSL